MGEESDKLRKKQRRGLKKNLLIEKQIFRIKGSRACDQSLNFFKNTTVNEKYQQNNMQSDITIPRWQKHSKEISKARGHPKKLLGLPNQFSSVLKVTPVV